MGIEQMLEEAIRKSKQDSAPSLTVEARLELTRELYGNYKRRDDDGHNPDVKVGDLVVMQDYMSIYNLPSAATPGVLHETFPPVRGHDIGEEGITYIMETYDCTVAFLHECHGSANLVFVPANTRRLRKYEPTE